MNLSYSSKHCWLLLAIIVDLDCGDKIYVGDRYSDPIDMYCFLTFQKLIDDLSVISNIISSLYPNRILADGGIFRSIASHQVGLNSV